MIDERLWHKASLSVSTWLVGTEQGATVCLLMEAKRAQTVKQSSIWRGNKVYYEKGEKGQVIIGTTMHYTKLSFKIRTLLRFSVNWGTGLVTFGLWSNNCHPKGWHLRIRQASSQSAAGNLGWHWLWYCRTLQHLTLNWLCARFGQTSTTGRSVYVRTSFLLLVKGVEAVRSKLKGTSSYTAWFNRVRNAPLRNDGWIHSPAWASIIATWWLYIQTIPLGLGV